MKLVALLSSILFAAAAAAASERVVLPKTVVPISYDLAIVPNAAAKTFTGTVGVVIDVKKATSDIVLNAAELKFTHVGLSGRKDAPSVRFDDKTQTATLHFAQPVKAGLYTLTIAYSGTIQDSAAGLFALDYDAGGAKRRAIFTQFENSDARRFLPCWDEPGVKSVFTLTATMPQAEMAISNMPVASETKLPGGVKKVRFQPSPKMSSYLLFYGQGDFERVAKMVGAVEVGVVVKRGDTEKAKFALDAAAEILPYYNDYFGTPYPLPKLDLIAGPGQSEFFGAMENWGAIFFFEQTLLVDPAVAGEGQKRGRWETIAHEMAHQWFGDLVTMAWWDDLWLNEGFASWMEGKAADKLHPDWNVGLSSVRQREYAMGTDSRRGTHPVVQPIYDVLQASEAFDEITYIKGSAVIRMLENYLGEDAFRSGVRAYMKKHAYANTVTDDLWSALEQASGQPVTDIAHDFTLKPGIPLIKVARTQTGVTLTQDRFSTDDSGKDKLSWHVPVTVKTADGKPVWRGVVADAPVAIAVPNGAAVVVNAGQAGYFRTLYDDASFAPLAAAYAKLSPYDELGLMSDASAMASAGLKSPGDALSLAAAGSPDMDPKVQEAVADHLARAVDLLEDMPGEARARVFGRSVLAPMFARLGWDARDGEDSNTTLLRNRLIGVLGATMMDPAVMAEARARFDRFLADRRSIDPEQRLTILDVVATRADAAVWEKLHQLAKTSADSMEKQEYFELLGEAKDKALAENALALTLGDEIPATLRPAVVAVVAGEHPERAFDFARAHRAELDALLEPTSRSQYYFRLASGTHDETMLAKLDAYAATVPETARGSLVKVKAIIGQSIKLRREISPKIDEWLTARCKEAKGAVTCAK